MKKQIRNTWIATAICLVLLLALVGCAAAPDDAPEITGATTWSFDAATGELTISGKGRMDDYTVYTLDDLSFTHVDDRPWKDHVRAIRSVRIEKGVTSIGSHAFEECAALTQISLPSTLECIGKRAFFDTAITTIEIPESVTRIEEGAFKFSKLTTVTFAKESRLQSIGDGAFSSCRLTSIVIPDRVTELGKGVFGFNKSLTSITLPKNLTKLPSHLLQFCSSLTTVELPSGITEIEDSAFASCSALSSITLPDGVTKIGWRVFECCPNLTEIHLPASLTSIGPYAFERCTGLTAVTVADGGGVDVDKTAFIGCPIANEKDFIFRDTSTDAE